MKIDISIIKELSKEAGEIAMGYFKNVAIDFKDSDKDLFSLVTEADKSIEKFLRERLIENYPDVGIVGEEFDDYKPESEYKWYLDPIDGTTNFSRHNEIWGISIGLAYKEKPILGVIYFPVFDQLYWAETGTGAFCNEVKLQVSNRAIKQSIYLCGAIYKSGKRVYPVDLIPHVGAIKAELAAVYGMIQIARGSAEIYSSKTAHAFDLCAGAIIAQEAGAKVCNFEGRPWHTSDSNIFMTVPSVSNEVWLLTEGFRKN